MLIRGFRIEIIIIITTIKEGTITQTIITIVITTKTVGDVVGIAVTTEPNQTTTGQITETATIITAIEPHTEAKTYKTRVVGLVEV